MITVRKPNVQYIAVKALIRNSEGSVLVLKQSDQTITGGSQYHPPGGIVELGESLESCLIREVKEEIGVNVAVVGLFDVGEWQAERGNDIMQFVGIFYSCRMANDNFKLQASEVSAVAWVDTQAIDGFDIVEPSKSIIKKFLTQ